MEENAVNSRISLEAAAEDRRGRYANFFTISTGDRIAVLDCFLVDVVAADDEGPIRSGVLTSRVLVDATAVVQLRDMLSEHIEKNGWAPENA